MLFTIDIRLSFLVQNLLSFTNVYHKELVESLWLASEKLKSDN